MRTQLTLPIHKFQNFTPPPQKRWNRGTWSLLIREKEALLFLIVRFFFFRVANYNITRLQKRAFTLARACLPLRRRPVQSSFRPSESSYRSTVVPFLLSLFQPSLDDDGYITSSCPRRLSTYVWSATFHWEVLRPLTLTLFFLLFQNPGGPLLGIGRWHRLRDLAPPNAPEAIRRESGRGREATPVASPRRAAKAGGSGVAPTDQGGWKGQRWFVL